MTELERRPLEEARRLEVAYHEAGHAVAHYVLWRPFHYVTIIPEGDSAGHCESGPIPDFDSQFFEGSWDALVRDQAVVCLAGPISARTLRGEIQYTAEEVFTQLTSDDQTVVDMAVEDSAAVITRRDGVQETDISPPLDEMLAAAVGIVQDHWGAIDAVAQKLLTHKTLAAAEVYEIVGRAPREVP